MTQIKNKPLVILGINAWHADASAAIFVDGHLLAAIEEERLSRVKHAAGFPVLAVLFCLREAGLKFEDVDFYAIGRDPKAKMGKKIKYLLRQGIASFSALKERWGNRKKISSVAAELARLSGLDENKFSGKIKNIEHHRSHLASAFFASPYEDAACISIDGSGDFTTTMTAFGKGNNIEVLQSLDFPHSIGIFYTACTQLLGFPHYGDEYKVMGMAPYGKPVLADQLRKLIQPTDDGLFRLDLSYFIKGSSGIISYGDNNVPVVAPLYSKKMIALFGEPRDPKTPLTQDHKDFAASVQFVTEEIIFHMLQHLHKKTNCDRLCLAGGVAQNSVANGKITRNTGFKEVYIPSAGHDAGISLGAALYVQHQQEDAVRTAIFSPYTGSKFSPAEIQQILEAKAVKYQQYDEEELYEVITNKIIEGGVVGWFTGRAEFGPRALGGRSILADPRRNDAKEILNVKIKRRESFRPFAPSILKEYVKDFFELEEPVPFMEKVFPIKKEKQELIPAVTHADGSGRLQSVDKNISPRYYRLINTFYEKTGIPILLNTSFNENEPIVNTPGEALDCYLRTNMDMLVLENFIIERK